MAPGGKVEVSGPCCEEKHRKAMLEFWFVGWFDGRCFQGNAIEDF